MIDDKRYQILMEEIRGIRNEVSRIDRDLGNDREHIGDLVVKMETLAQEVKQMRTLLKGSEDRVQDKVYDVLKPAVKEVAALKEEIKEKHTIVLTSGKFMDKIKKWLGGGEQHD